MTSLAIQQSGDRARGIDIAALPGELRQVRERVEAPFSPARLALAASVGAQILRGRRANVSPAVVHFAYWTRSAALTRLADGFHQRLPDGCQARPVGLVFHLPPQNVETVFLYSWMLSYLAGNANIVRLPSTLSAEMRGLLELFLEAFEGEDEGGQLFVRYPSDSEASVAISAESDARVVWGGDAKVRAFADIPLRQGGKSVWFGDRFSLGVVDGQSLGALDSSGLDELAARLCNDIYVFDQMACSSPHVLYVVGERSRHGEAVTALFNAVARVAAAKGFAPPTGHAIQKIVEVFASIGRGEAQDVYWRSNLLTAAETRTAGTVERRVGGGYLEYRYVSALDDLQPMLREHHQTLTYFGFDRAAMVDFAAGRAHAGLTRIVPMGQALDFDFVWDGYDIPRELTRLVRVA